MCIHFPVIHSNLRNVILTLKWKKFYFDMDFIFSFIFPVLLNTVNGVKQKKRAHQPEFPKKKQGDRNES